MPDKLSSWISEASRVSGTEDFHKESVIPPWADPALVKEGQAFIRRNFFSILFTHLISLIILLAYPPVLAVVSKTGRSKDVVNSRRRYFSTLVHVKKWYEGDLTDPSSPAVQDILRVRRIHGAVAKKVGTLDIKKQSDQQHGDQADTTAMILRQELDMAADPLIEENNNNNNEEEEGQLATDDPMTQFDMSVTQFCFMGLLALYPRELGIPVLERREMNGFFHIWAIIGHILGIRPEFNLALPENKACLEGVWRRVLFPSFRTCSRDSVVLWVWLVEGLNYMVPFLTLKSLLLFMSHRILKVPKRASVLWSHCTLWDLLCFHLVNQAFSSWLQGQEGLTKLIRPFLNVLVRLAIWVFTYKLKFNVFL